MRRHEPSEVVKTFAALAAELRERAAKQRPNAARSAKKSSANVPRRHNRG